jgi:hypothetical protein
MDKFLGKRLFRHSHILLRAAVCMYAVCTYAVFVFYAVACMQYVNLLFVSMQCVVVCRGGRFANKFYKSQIHKLRIEFFRLANLVI